MNPRVAMRKAFSLFHGPWFVLVFGCLALLPSGCATLQETGTYHYSFDARYDISISKEFRHLGEFRTDSDSITIGEGGQKLLLNKCNGYETSDVYYIDKDNIISAALIIFKQQSFCSWSTPNRDLPNSFLEICSTEKTKYIEGISNLASSHGKSFSGCYQGMSAYGYIGKKTISRVYLFISNTEISREKDRAHALLMEELQRFVAVTQ